MAKTSFTKVARFRIGVLSLGLCASIAPALASSMQDSWDAVRGPQSLAHDENGESYILGECLVTVPLPTDLFSISKQIEGLGGEVIGMVPRFGVLRVLLPPEGTLDLSIQLSEWEQALEPHVLAVEPHYVGSGGAVSTPPDDTHFFLQWHLDNTINNAGTPGADIEALEAWKITTGSPDVVIAVLDSGIDFTNPEFLGRTLPGYDFVGEDPDATADHNHGIYVSGLLGANTNNALGVAGVDQGCMILPLKVLNQSNGGSTFDLIQALDYCALNRPDVVSMSLINFPGVLSLETALQGAKDAGCILISCGNNSNGPFADNSYPGGSPHTIAIAWSTSTDARATNSSWGSSIDFIAPGSGVRTTDPTGSGPSTSFSGCSAATPVAAGIVGLMLSRHPLLTQDQAYALFQLGAEDQVGASQEDTPGYDQFHGHGRLNARASLEAMDSSPGTIGYHCSPASPNSTGFPAHISAEGDAAVAANQLTLRSEGMPPNAFGYFLMGTGSGTSIPPGALGELCLIGGPIWRLKRPIQMADASGSFEAAIGTQTVPGFGPIPPGASFAFQAWFRDGTLSNFSDALRIEFF